jgi:FkbM family methyltransferase
MSVLSTCIDAYFEGKKIVFFGAGQYSGATIGNIRAQISYFCDNAPGKQGGTFWGVPVYRPEELLKEDRNKTRIIVNVECYREIAKQLFDMGFEDIRSGMYKRANERIPRTIALDSRNFLQRKADAISRYDTREISRLFADDPSRETFDKLIEKYKRGDFDFSDVCCKDSIYFNDIFRDAMREDDVYADAGAFDGKTVVDFILYTKGKYKKIYAFEPDAINYFSLNRELADCRDTVAIQAGLSDVDGRRAFDARGTQSSKIVADDDAAEASFAEIRTVRLDTYAKKSVTFIKMDIEGEEYKALLGARETIREQRPKLAISVYHNDDDLVKIPLLIHETVPAYRFFLRHHTTLSVDTVLYARL